MEVFQFITFINKHTQKHFLLTIFIKQYKYRFKSKNMTHFFDFKT